MSKKNLRVKESSKFEKILKYIHKYSYLETIFIVSTFLIIGYIINPDDICFLDYDVPFLLVLLAVLTLFHGFENGILAMTIVSLVMLISYKPFPYVDFMVLLLMTLIYSEFYYYWMQKIKKAEVEANYKGIKLAELSRAFYSLKISHDQLEKNYVLKPMSIRNSLIEIKKNLLDIPKSKNVEYKLQKNYKDFLKLIQKSFNVTSGLVLYKKELLNDEDLNFENCNIVFGDFTDEVSKEEIFENYIVDKSIARKIPVYISDETGEPDLKNKFESRYIAAIPAIYDDKIESVLVIENMPFMAFERENLTSIAILIEYFAIELKKYFIHMDVLEDNKINIDFILDDSFKFEVYRLLKFFNKYNINSVFLVLQIKNELQTIRLYEKIDKMLRSLDMVTKIQIENRFYIAILLPLHDKSAALGFLNRLVNSIKDDDKDFNYMTFDLSRLDLFSKYITDKSEYKV